MTTTNSPVRLSQLLSLAFVPVHEAIKAGTHNQFILKGGRGSAKSSYVPVEVLLQLLKNPRIHAMVLRKVQNTLRTSVYAQYQWTISMLGLEHLFKCTTSPMEIVYLETGQKIYFFGADDPGKMKSVKVPFGHIGILHFEELDQFSGAEEVRSIEQSVLRGGAYSLEFKVFNPPRTAMNWANQYCLLQKDKQLIHHSTYLTTPPHWLGPRFLDDAEYLKSIDPEAYEHEYGGNANGTGGMVFANVKVEEIPDEQIKTFDRIYQGIDWGYYPDPFHYSRSYYHAASRTLYIFGEYRDWKKGNADTAAEVQKRFPDAGDFPLTADSAEKKSTADYRQHGLRNIRNAIKGPGSVEYSHKWLQSLAGIVIDPVRCPYTHQEFSQYEYEKAKDGSIISGYPDKNNHAIDSIRYALEQVWKRRGT